MIVKTGYTILLAFLLLADSVFLGLTAEQLIVALSGAFSGSFLLNRFSAVKNTTWSERIIKILSSAIGGTFIGAAICKYFNLESLQYIGAAFFLTSFVVLIFLRALLSTANDNAKGIVTTIFSRILQIDDSTIKKETKVITTDATEREMQAVHGSAVSEVIKKD